MELQPGPHAKVLDCSIDEDEDDIASGGEYYTLFARIHAFTNVLAVSLEWLPGDEFAAFCRVSLVPEDELREEDAIAGPGEYEISWRR